MALARGRVSPATFLLSKIALGYNHLSNRTSFRSDRIPKPAACLSDARPAFEINLELGSRKSLGLPAIQREFVWDDDQICRLFDRPRQGYPFGTFLSWQIEAGTASKFNFYEFMRRYHERDARTCRELPNIAERQVLAILDGNSASRR